MSTKPTYEELEQRVKELEEEAFRHERARDALWESEMRCRRITEALTDYVFRVLIEDGQPVETAHGPGCVAVTGYSPEDFALDPYLWIRMVHEEDRVVVEEQARHVLLGQDVQPIEHRILRKDGIIRWVMNTLVPYCDQQGNLLSYDGLVRDIHERKQAEEALRKAHDELELRVERRTAELVKANEALQHQMEERKRLEKALMQREKLNTLGSIAAEVAHEIRNPLVSIGGFAQRLKQKFPDLPECNIILRESERLEKILSRIESYLEPVEIHAKECSINTIITDCMNLLSPETEARHLKYVLDLAARLPATYVDPEVLAQIFTNLIRNALEAMDKGESLFVKSFETDQDLIIEFKNKSSGLKIEDPDALFMPFAEGGKNFGLSLCYRLLKDMGGLLTFTQENEYMIFTVSVPNTFQPSPEKAVHDGAEQERPRDWAIYG